MDVPLIGPSYYLPQQAQSGQRTCNLYIEQLEAQGRTQVMLVRRPGIQGGLGVNYSANGAVRALHATDEYLYVVSGANFYRTPRSLSTAQQFIVELAAGTENELRGKSGPAIIRQSTNGTQLVVLDGITAYTLDLTSIDPRLIEIDDPEMMGRNTTAIGPGRMSGPPTAAAVLNGYTIFAGDGSGRFAVSDLNNARSWNGLWFETAMAAPDPVVWVETFQRAAWIFGSTSIEIWFDVGVGNDTTLFPLARQGNIVIEVGCAAPRTVQQLDRSLIWLGAEGNGAIGVYQNNGYQAVPVSTRAVTEAVSRCSEPWNAEAWCYSHNGHNFYILRLPQDPIAWVYDTAAKQWFEWYSGTIDRPSAWWPTCHAAFAGRHVVGGPSGIAELLHGYGGDGAGAYIVEPGYPDLRPDSPAIQRLRRTPPMADPEGARIFFHEFELFGTPGVGNDLQQDPNTVSYVKYERGPERVGLRYSNDGGMTWTDAGIRSAGGDGEYGKRTRWMRCGSGRSRVWEISSTSPAPSVWLGARTRAVKGDS